MDAIDIDNDADNSVTNPNLIVTFSDTDSSDEKGMVQLEYYREEGILPTAGWWMPLEGYQGWWINIDLTLPLEMKIYKDVKLNIIAPALYLLEFDTKETQSITIPGDASMTDIKDHPSFWFLTQVLEFRLTNPYPSREDPLHDEKCDEYALLAAKILDYANHRRRTISPSWTLAKDVPDDVILDMIAMIDQRPQSHCENVTCRYPPEIARVCSKQRAF